MLFGQRIITKHHFDEWSVNRSGTCGFNFLPNTQVVDLRKNALLDVRGAATLKDIESHWTQMGPGFAPLHWSRISLPHSISSVNSLSFLLNPNLNSTSDSQNIGWEKSRDQQCFFFSLFNFDEKETISLRFNLESFSWQTHRVRPIGLNLESVGSR